MQKYFSRANIYLVGKQVMPAEEVQRFLDSEADVWITDTDNPAQRIPELAGRVCYMSFGEKQGRKDNASYLGHIMQVGHGSVLEHAVFSLLLTGVSRSLTHELVRHRAGFAYSQLSQRYVDETEAQFVIPPAVQGDAALEKLLKDFCDESLKVYGELTDKLAEKYATPEGLVDFALREEQLTEGETGKFTFGEAVDGADQLTIEEWRARVAESEAVAKYFKKKTIRGRRKSAREAARSVLPNATETKIFVTGNVRSWRHFIELRGDIHAEAEIRALACDVARVLKKEAPNLFGDYEIVKLPDGSERTRTTHRKV
ncbi:MAG: FAD-dependent thymidylate synthase [Planctomycetes bacterium]|nr:FAD-dependent thymidylate synthase [Planctomycetota bacterium]